MWILIKERGVELKKITFIGTDYWSRLVYRDDSGKLWKDTNLGCGVLDLHRATSNEFEGEPDYPIADEYEIVDELPSEKSCDTCDNAGLETWAKVSACNCCENNEFYVPRKEITDENG